MATTTQFSLHVVESLNSVHIVLVFFSFAQIFCCDQPGLLSILLLGKSTPIQQSWQQKCTHLHCSFEEIFLKNYLHNSGKVKVKTKKLFEIYPYIFQCITHVLISRHMNMIQNSGVNKKHQKFIFEYWVFSQKSYLNMWCFEKIHICIPKIQYLHTN